MTALLARRSGDGPLFVLGAALRAGTLAATPAVAAVAAAAGHDDAADDGVVLRVVVGALVTAGVSWAARRSVLGLALWQVLFGGAAPPGSDDRNVRAAAVVRRCGTAAFGAAVGAVVLDWLVRVRAVTPGREQVVRPAAATAALLSLDALVVVGSLAALVGRVVWVRRRVVAALRE